MYLTVTRKKLNAIINIVDEFEAMIGCGEDDSSRLLWVAEIKKMYIDNGIKPEIQ